MPAGNPTASRDEERGDRELDRRAKFSMSSCRISPPVRITARDPARQTADEFEVLNGQRPIQTSASRICSICSALGLLPGESDRRIARDEPQREEDNGDDAEQHR